MYFDPIFSVSSLYFKKQNCEIGNKKLRNIAKQRWPKKKKNSLNVCWCVGRFCDSAPCWFPNLATSIFIGVYCRCMKALSRVIVCLFPPWLGLATDYCFPGPRGALWGQTHNKGQKKINTVSFRRIFYNKFHEREKLNNIWIVLFSKPTNQV